MRGDGPCLDRGGPPTLARDSRFSALSDAAGPQPASPAKSIGSGAAPGADTADTGTVVMDACPQPFQVTWSRLGRGWIGNGLREGAVAEALYLMPGQDGPACLRAPHRQAHQTKR